jgi:hypothetical protein
MHGGLFAPCNLFVYADFRPEPAIITTQYASFACAVIATTCLQQQPVFSNNLLSAAISVSSLG